MAAERSGSVGSGPAAPDGSCRRSSCSSPSSASSWRSCPGVLATPHILGAAVSTVFYVSNWYSIHGGVTYFSLSSQPSPLLHTWSLAIEEQFYLVWPLVVLARAQGRHVGAARARRRRAGAQRPPVLGGGRLSLVGVRRRTGDDPEWTRRRRLHVALRGGLPGIAGLGPPHGPASPRTGTRRAPTTAPTPGPRRCWSARRSPSG